MRGADGEAGLRIDPTTLSDLEVFASSDGSAGIFALVDRTDTEVGRAALRRRLERPSCDAATIRATQAAVGFLARHPDLVALDDRRVEAVRRYLDSNIELAPSGGVRGLLARAWITLRYRGILREVREGVEGTTALFAEVAGLCRTVERLGPPPLLQELLSRLEATAAEVARAAAQQGGALAADGAFRGALRGEIGVAIRSLGELDALSSMASAGAEHGWIEPEILDSDDFLFEGEGLWHPFLEEPRPNPVGLTGSEPMVFLTGPNMAGKTTYLRSVGLVVLLAQVGMAVPGRGVRLAPVEALFTSLSPNDDLKAGLSYFLAEVIRVKEAATILAEGARALILFDEVFRGTNVKDALEASAEVILGFARARRSAMIFSSHLAELAGTLERAPTILFRHFSGEIVDGGPRYSFTLREGVSSQRFGRLLLQQAGVPELLERIRG